MKKILFVIFMIYITILCSCISQSRLWRPMLKDKVSTYSDVIKLAKDKWNRGAARVKFSTKWKDSEQKNIKIANFKIDIEPHNIEHLKDIFYADMETFCECNQGTFNDLSAQDLKRIQELRQKHSYIVKKTLFPKGKGPFLFECGPEGRGSVHSDWSRFNSSMCRQLYERKIDYRKVAAEYGNPPTFICNKEDHVFFMGTFRIRNRSHHLRAGLKEPKSRKRYYDSDSGKFYSLSEDISIQLNQAKDGSKLQKNVMQLVKIGNYPIKIHAGDADKTDAEALFKLGVQYEKGRGVEQNYTEAAKFYKRAAILGHAIAQDYLGFLYAKGRGVPQDNTEAIKWFRKSVSQGARSGQNNLAYMYAVGRGVPQNYDEAFKLYSLSAAQGHLQAQNNLGMMYVNGQGTPQNYAEAIKWFRKAANKGLALAQYNLGHMYLYGLGIATNNFEAAKWYKKAAAQGHPAARTALEKISKKIYNAR